MSSSHINTTLTQVGVCLYKQLCYISNSTVADAREALKDYYNQNQDKCQMLYIVGGFRYVHGQFAMTYLITRQSLLDATKAKFEQLLSVQVYGLILGSKEPDNATLSNALTAAQKHILVLQSQQHSAQPMMQPNAYRTNSFSGVALQTQITRNPKAHASTIKPVVQTLFHMPSLLTDKTMSGGNDFQSPIPNSSVSTTTTNNNNNNTTANNNQTATGAKKDASIVQQKNKLVFGAAKQQETKKAVNNTFDIDDDDDDILVTSSRNAKKSTSSTLKKTQSTTTTTPSASLPTSSSTETTTTTTTKPAATKQSAFKPAPQANKPAVSAFDEFDDMDDDMVVTTKKSTKKQNNNNNNKTTVGKKADLVIHSSSESSDDEATFHGYGTITKEDEIDDEGLFSEEEEEEKEKPKRKHATNDRIVVDSSDDETEVITTKKTTKKTMVIDSDDDDDADAYEAQTNKHRKAQNDELNKPIYADAGSDDDDDNNNNNNNGDDIEEDVKPVETVVDDDATKKKRNSKKVAPPEQTNKLQFSEATRINPENGKTQRKRTVKKSITEVDEDGYDVTRYVDIEEWYDIPDPKPKAAPKPPAAPVETKPAQKKTAEAKPQAKGGIMAFFGAKK